MTEGMRQNRGQKKLWIGMGLVLTFASGCEPLFGLAERLGIEMKWKSQSAGGKAGDPNAPTSEAGKRAQAHAELLREVYQVVTLEEPQDPQEFTGFLENLNQGGTLEGLYNGFTHSEVYRQREQKRVTVSDRTLPVFAKELVYLTLEQANPTIFTAEDALPLQRAVEPGVPEELGVPAGKSSDSKIAVIPRDIDKLAEHYEKLFARASFFTLKRVLADEAMKVFAIKASSPDALSEWYGAWASRTSKLGVNFGLELRNRGDEKFHADFAKKAAPDRVRWEVLNRVHRVLNATLPKSASPAPASSAVPKSP